MNLRLWLAIEDSLLFGLLVFDVLFDDCVFNCRFFGLLDFILNSVKEGDAENKAPNKTVAEHRVLKSAILKEISEHSFRLNL